MKAILGLAMTALLLFSGCVKKDSPYDLTYPDLKYVPPRVKEHRVTLKNGIVAYVVEDKKLPVFDIHAIIRTGSIEDPEDKGGLAELTAMLLESGGTRHIKSDSLDELLEFHAASLSSGCGLTSAEVSLSLLSENTDFALHIFNEVLRYPAFEKKKINLSKTKLVETIKRRFDHPKISLQIIYDYAVYGKGKISDLITEADIHRIQKKDILKFYSRYYRPENLIIAVSGRFDKSEMEKKLNNTLGAWQPAGTPETVFPDIPASFKKSFYFVEKPINQAYIRMGLPLLKRPHPDYYPLTLMNWVLGGASFTSRISKKIREHEGLAYHAGSSVRCGYFFPGNFNVYLETKSPSAAYALRLVFDEIKRFLKDGALEAELAAGKQSLIDAFPAIFKTGEDIAVTFASSLYRKRADDHFDVYRDKIRAIGLDEIDRVAKEYINPENMAICIVGKFNDCKAGDDIHKTKLSDFGNIKVLEEKDVEKLCTN
jgi:predicted Zn-dependent peptidase